MLVDIGAGAGTDDPHGHGVGAADWEWTVLWILVVAIVALDVAIATIAIGSNELGSPPGLKCSRLKYDQRPTMHERALMHAKTVTMPADSFRRRQ